LGEKMEKLRDVWVFSFIRSIVEWIVASAWRYFLLIFLLSLALRVNQLNQVSRRYLLPTKDRELGAIAISLLNTGEFADPYVIPTGPTAHLPPIPPLKDSLIYRALGLTHRAGYVRAISIILITSVLYGMLPWFSERLGTGKAAGVIAGLIGTIGGLEGGIWSMLPGHGEFLTGLIMGLLLVAFLQRWKKPNGSWKGSLLLGLAIGVSFHVQPALLPVILGCMLFELWWQQNSPRWVLVGVIALGILVACVPWGWRNYRTFNAVFFIRSNLGGELRLAYNDTTAATFEEMDAKGAHYIHPRALVSEARKLIDLGEIEYMNQAGSEALAWVSAHPAESLWLIAQRFGNLWAGPLHRPVADSPGVLTLTILAIVGAWRSFPRITIAQRAAILIPLATYPLIYYIVAYMPRYRIPIDWILYILTGAAAWQLIGGSFRTSRTD
jgi:4-amino-4-deoxy-L-arabinose transferase-like glycosyltransferase